MEIGLTEQFGVAGPWVANYKNSVIIVSEPITQATAQRVINELMFLDSEYPGQEITLIINSGGGSVSDGLAIIDTCRRISSPVATIGCGMCASMGAVLLACCGAKGRRFVTEHCEVMLHQPSSQVEGKSSDIEIHTRHIQRLRQVLEAMLSEASGLDEASVHVMCDRDRWLTAEEAVSFGFADETISPR